MTVVPSPTWLSSIRLLGPMTQPGPMTVDPPQDGAGQDAGPRCDLDGVLDDHGGAVDQDSVGDMPQQDLHAGLLGGFQRGACGAQRLGVVFHIKRLLTMSEKGPCTLRPAGHDRPPEEDGTAPERNIRTYPSLY